MGRRVYNVLQGRMRWWIFGRVKGKLVCMGGYSTENEALTAAGNVADFDSEPDIKSYRTTQMAVAKACYKNELSQKTGKLGESLLPIRARVADKKREEDHDDVFKTIV